MKHVGAEKLVQLRTQSDFIAKTAWIEPQMTKLRFRVVKKIASKHWEPLKRNVLISWKEVLWIGFKRRKLYCGILVHDWLGPESQKIYDSLDLFEGADNVLPLQTEVRDEVGERVSPECNENVASKRNLKNECKKLERHPLQKLQLCRWRLDKRHGKITFFRWICWTTERDTTVEIQPFVIALSSVYCSCLLRLVLQNTDKQKSCSTTKSLCILLLIPQRNFNCKA